MRSDLSNIIAALISNIGRVKDNFTDDNMILMNLMAIKLCQGLEEIETMWPNLTDTEKQEIKAVISLLKTTYSLVDEESLQSRMQVI